MSLRFCPSRYWSTLVITLGSFGDDEDVRSQIEDLLGNVAVDAVDERHYGDDRGHANHHAQQREYGPQFVRPQRSQGDTDVLQQYSYRFRRGGWFSLTKGGSLILAALIFNMRFRVFDSHKVPIAGIPRCHSFEIENQNSKIAL